MFVVKRNKHNPILKPNEKNYWEAQAAFNWCTVKTDDTYHTYYRAQSQHDLLYGPNLSLSTIGYAQSKDGIHFEYNQQIIVPEQEWEQYGCEDPRATNIEDKTYIFYTALSKFPFAYDGIKVACAVISKGTKVEEKHLVTPFNAKAMTLFPEKINGKYVALLTVHPDQPPSSICVAEFDSLEQMWDMNYWQHWYAAYKEHELYLLRGNGDHVEIGAPPIKTDKGWLLIYSHIYNYMSDKKKFGVEAVLLDYSNPKKIISRTNYPFLVPEVYYEKEGDVANIVFPSGALVEDNVLKIYYGGADTVCCLAELCYSDFLNSFEGASYKEAVTRYAKNPILEPKRDRKWASQCVFNPTAIEIDGKIHILYRAMGDDNTSVIGYATTTNGLELDADFDHPIYVPRESFELKRNQPNGFSGCEDPRITRIDDKLYMVYTAYDGVNPPRVAATSIFVTEFLRQDWKWSSAKLITPETVDDKDACIFQNKVDGKIIAIHRVSSHICLDYLDSVDFELNKIDKCIPLMAPRPGMWDSAKVGISGPPLETEAGWLLLYHGVSDDGVYRVGAALLEYNNPANVISRTSDYIFEPKEDYELIGVVNNVVFPCGAVIRDNLVYIYYGGADKVVGVATLNLKNVLEALLF